MKLIFNAVLLLFSTLLFTVLSIAGLCYRLFCVRKKISEYFYGGSSTQSHGANYFGGDLWNVILIRPGAVNHFGNRDESMSGVLGKNAQTKSLTRLGKCVVFILDCLERDHTERAIENDEK